MWVSYGSPAGDELCAIDWDCVVFTLDVLVESPVVLSREIGIVTIRFWVHAFV